MKKILLLLLALIVVPAWAADTAPAPSASASSEQAAQPAQKPVAKKHKKAKVGGLGCTIQSCSGIEICSMPRCMSQCAAASCIGATKTMK